MFLSTRETFEFSSFSRQKRETCKNSVESVELSGRDVQINVYLVEQNILIVDKYFNIFVTSSKNIVKLTKICWLYRRNNYLNYTAQIFSWLNSIFIWSVEKQWFVACQPRIEIIIGFRLVHRFGVRPSRSRFPSMPLRGESWAASIAALCVSTQSTSLRHTLYT